MNYCFLDDVWKKEKSPKQVISIKKEEIVKDNKNINKNDDMKEFKTYIDSFSNNVIDIISEMYKDVANIKKNVMMNRKMIYEILNKDVQKKSVGLIRDDDISKLLINGILCTMLFLLFSKLLKSLD